MIHCELFRTARLAPVELPAAESPAPHAVASAAPDGAAPFRCQLPFVMQKQAQDNWCWAAVSVSVAAFYSPASTWTQPDLVSHGLKNPACATDGSSPACDISWALDKALGLTKHLHTWNNGVAPVHTLRSELGAKRPIGCRIEWNGGGAHFVAITGYHDDGVNQGITVDDSCNGRSHVDLAAFPAVYHHHGGTWSHHYLTHP